MSMPAPGQAPFSPSQVQQIHSMSDVDSSVRAQHHTIGSGPFQAASGQIVQDLQTASTAQATSLATVQTSVTTLTSQVGTLNTEVAALQSYSPMLQGTTAQRTATTSKYWQQWYDTTTGHLYVGDKSGGWRQMSGSTTITQTAWGMSAAGPPSFVGSTLTFTAPTTLLSGEALVASQIGGGTGYSFVGEVSAPTGTSPTVTVRFMQLNAMTVQNLALAWTLVVV